MKGEMGNDMQQNVPGRMESGILHFMVLCPKPMGHKAITSHAKQATASRAQIPRERFILIAIQLVSVI